MRPRRTLVLAWGNPGRLDDGLGAAVAESIARLGLPGVWVETDYQLQMEHAADLAHCSRVFFVDADRSGPEPFSVRRLEPSPRTAGFTSHSVSPGALLAIARDLFGARPEAWLLGVRGYEFDDFGERLSPGGRRDLELAVEWLVGALTGDAIGPVNAPPSPAHPTEKGAV